MDERLENMTFIIVILQQIILMSQKRPWSQEQDRLLKFVFETSRLTKWSHIARKLQEDHGVRGRNGKQCKERYVTSIDTNHPKEEWSYSDEQRMFDLHNELGNKWAVIGTRLGGRSDNCVKNHFYSRLRKALRNINKVVVNQHRRDLKQFKPNVLYRIVEVAEEKFKLLPCFDPEFISASNQLKNDLLDFSYDDEIAQQTEERINEEEAKEFIEKIVEFGHSYKKKVKRERRGSGQETNLLPPYRYQPTKSCGEENDQSERSSIILLSEASNISNIEDISDDEIQRIHKEKKSRKGSIESASTVLCLPRVRTRATSQNNFHQVICEEKYQKMEEEERPVAETQTVKMELEHEDGLGVEGILTGLRILEESHNLPHPLLMKKETSQYSRFQDASEEQFRHFFEDSQIEIGILPEMPFGNRLDSQIEENMFR